MRENAKSHLQNSETIKKDINWLRSGEYERTETTTQVILRFFKSKSPKTGNQLPDHETIKKIVDEHMSVGGALKKTYRKRSELPDPNKKANAEANRLRKMFGVRVLPEIKDGVDEAAKNAGMTRQEWVEMVLQEALKYE